MLSLTLRATTTLTCSLHSSGYLSVCNRDGFMMQYCKSGMWGAGLYFAEKASCECLRLKCCSTKLYAPSAVQLGTALLHIISLAIRNISCLGFAAPFVPADSHDYSYRCANGMKCLDTTQQQAEALHPRHSVFCFVNNVTCVDTTGLFCFVCVRTCR
jgi:hypothetical protein